MVPTRLKIASVLLLGVGLLAAGGAAPGGDKDKLEIKASTFFQGWEPERLIDGKLETSWFSDSGDAAAKCTKPTITITFPEDVTVTRVTVAGNREPDYPDNYSVLAGKVEFLDANGKQLFSEERDAAGKRFDFEFKPKEAVKKVRSIKFVSVKDQGDKNDFSDIALGEFLVE